MKTLKDIIREHDLDMESNFFEDVFKKSAIEDLKEILTAMVDKIMEEQRKQIYRQLDKHGSKKDVIVSELPNVALDYILENAEKLYYIKEKFNITEEEWKKIKEELE